MRNFSARFLKFLVLLNKAVVLVVAAVAAVIATVAAISCSDSGSDGYTV